VGPMILTQVDLALLKQLKAAGLRGRDIRELSTRRTLDRLVKGHFVVARPIGFDGVQYRITQRGQDAIFEHDL
jgi:hypothetical protein